jgi:hypothetical protein
MAEESKSPDELKPDVVKPKIDKPDVDSKSNNAQPKEEVVDTNSHFGTNKKYKDQDVLINWVCDEVAKLGFTVVIVKSDYDSFGRKQYFLLGCEKGGAYKSTNKKSKFDRLKQGNANVYLDSMVIFWHHKNEILRLCLAYTTISWTKS